MSRYRCVIIDDEPLARELLAAHLSQLNQFELIDCCASAVEAGPVLKQQPVDLIFLDIEMPVLNGTDFYKSLTNKPHVIFTTAYRDYAVEGFELDAVDYLLKPITFARFFNAIDKFLGLKQQQKMTLTANKSEHNSLPHDYLFVRKDRKQVKVMFKKIFYISGLKDYIEIHLADETHVIKSSLMAFEKKLPNQFIRIHRSYIVNKEKITAYTQHDVEIDQIEIPVGELYKKNLYNRL